MSQAQSMRMTRGTEMKRHSPNRKVVHYTVGSTLAALLIAGVVDAGPLGLTGNGTAIAAESTRSVDRAVTTAERAVEKAPRDATARVMLAHTYLQAGRFESAVQTLRDAQA